MMAGWSACCSTPSRGPTAHTFSRDTSAPLPIAAAPIAAADTVRAKSPGKPSLRASADPSWSLGVASSMRSLPTAER